MNVCVVALGKIGLPVAVQIASKGHRVIGCDVDAGVVASVNAGTPPFRGEAGLDELLAQVTRDGNLTATTDVTGTVGASDVVVVLVPLSVDASAKPDFAALDTATASIGSGLQPDTLVVYETTLPVGVTRQRLAPALAAASGLTPGRDLFVAFSPERVRSGRILSDLRRYPKIVGGIDDESTARAVRFYEAVLDFDPRPDLTRGNGVWAMGSAEEAELAKLTDTTYRDVNIALANEFALMCERLGVSSKEVIDAAATKPFGFMAFYPGPGIGGHCIPVDPLYLSWKMRLSGYEARFIALADEINRGMPGHVVRLVAEALNDVGRALKGARVLVLGVAYKRGVGDTRESPAFEVISALRTRGAVVTYTDPYVPTLRVGETDLKAVELTREALQEADCVLILTNHPEFDYDVVASEARLIVDTRQAIPTTAGGNARVVRL